MENSIIKRRLKKDKGLMVQITSMMDMFTIILVFLLLHTTQENQKLMLNKDIKLPESNSEKSYKEAVNILLTSNNIFVEQKRVAKVRGKTILAKVEDDKIVPLYHLLVRLRKHGEFNKDMEGMILFQADRNASFEIIDKIIRTAAFAGFPNFQFAVLKKG